MWVLNSPNGLRAKCEKALTATTRWIFVDFNLGHKKWEKHREKDNIYLIVFTRVGMQYVSKWIRNFSGHGSLAIRNIVFISYK